MIVLMTDFGLRDPYVSQMMAVLYRQAPGIPVINLFSHLPVFNPRASAYLIAAYVEEFPPGSVFLGIVDPGVGTERRPLVVEADGRWFVGPDNGLFDVVCKRAGGFRRWGITYKPETISVSFHGRDLFAPVAAQLAQGKEVPGEPLDLTVLPWKSWPEELLEVLYVDHYGNALTGVRASRIEKTATLLVKDRIVGYIRTFAEAPAGQPFWYENSNGLVEIAIKEGSVAELLRLEPGDSFRVNQY
ncbi:MAG: SAM-dependent chlorinase/fluorinase [Gammaproteobacteria bacterium]|nr:SAM-dependent chlorinase/fluorinase [Gammaproteobacteria bacterium]